MKLLFVLQELPYPASNGHQQKIQTLLNYLAQRHNCDVLAIGDSSASARCGPWLARFPRIHLLGVFSATPMRFLRLRQVLALVFASATQSALRFKSGDLEEALERAVSGTKYDVVHIDLISMVYCCSKLTKERKLLSLNDSLSLTMFGRFRNQFVPLIFRLREGLRGLLQMRIDKTLFPMADAVHFVGPSDTKWARSRLGALNAVHIPLAANSEWLDVVPSSDPRRDRTLVIVEKLWANEHKNAVELFLRVHWPPLRRKYPKLRLIVVGGKKMPDAFCSFVEALGGIELYEWVDRLQDILADASIAVFPYSVPVGMKTRVLQTMAAMNAVVGTPDAFSGLPVRNGLDAVVAGSHAEIASAIESLLDEPDRCRTIGRNARRFVQERFTEDMIGSAWENLYRDIAAGSRLCASYGAS